MAELVDALVLGTSGVTRESSSLSFRTNNRFEQSKNIVGKVLMDIVIEKNAGLERSLKVVIPADEFSKKLVGQLTKIQQNAKIDGFRKGKIPISIVRKKYGQEAKNEVINQLVQESFQKAIESEKIAPVAPPEVNVTNAREGEDLTYSAMFEVFPDVKIIPFSELKIQRDKVEITEPDVDKIAEKLRDQHKSWEDKAENSIIGDKVCLSFEGTIKGKSFEGSKAEDFEFVLGSGQMLKDFEDGLSGVSSNEEKKIEVQFPKEYPSSEVAGKKAIFEVKVKSVHSPVLPEINKDFVKKLGFDSGSVEEMRQEIKKKIEVESEQIIAKKMFNQMIDDNLKSATFALPKILLKREAENAKTQIQQQWLAKGKKLDVKSEDFVSEVNSEAEKRVKVALVVSELVKASSVKVSKEEIKEKIESFARTYKDPQEVLKWYAENPQQIQALESTILEQKLVEFAVANSVIEDIKTTFDDLSNPMQTSNS